MTLTTTTSRCCESLSSSVSSFSNDIFRRRLLSLSSSSRAETRPSSSEGRSIDDYAEKERRMCSRNSRASTSGRRTSLNTNNVKNKNYVNRRMFASDASPLVSSTIGETKKKKKSKNAAASTASSSAAESSNEDEETEEENENDSEDANENKEDNKSSRLVFTTSENDENDTFRGNKAGRLSTQAISKRGGGQEGAAGKQTRTSFYKTMTSRAQIDGMNC